MLVQNCQFNTLLNGAIVAMLKQNNIFVCRDNAFISCKLASVYAQGQCQPVICSNVFMMNKCPAIVLSNMTDGFVAINEFNINDNAVMIINNQSTVFGNKIQKSNDVGIVAYCRQDSENQSDMCAPLIMRNWIESSMHDGILCEGQYCIALIKANCIESNRKCGIRIINYARAHIGGDGTNGMELKKLSELEDKEEEPGTISDTYVIKI